MGSLIPVARHDAEEPGDEPGDEATDRSICFALTFEGHEDAPCSLRQAKAAATAGRRRRVTGQSRGWAATSRRPLVLLRDKASMSVALSAGVPLSLIESLATGIGQRQAWQRFTQSSCAAAWTVIADEVEAKLGVRPELDLSPAYGSDLTGRAIRCSKARGRKRARRQGARGGGPQVTVPSNAAACARSVQPVCIQAPGRRPPREVSRVPMEGSAPALAPPGGVEASTFM